MSIDEELQGFIYKTDIDFCKCIDISNMANEQTRGYTKALVIVRRLPVDFIEDIYTGRSSDISRFSETEHKTDLIAEEIANLLNGLGYKSYAQSENNLGINKEFNWETKRSPLPHKTLAVSAGLGFIGKNNLLVTKDYGCAICMCTVLTNAPLTTQTKETIEPKCGACTICQNICPPHVLKGQKWSLSTDRDKIVDVHKCVCCLKCMVNCPWTRGYVMRQISCKK